MNIFIEATERPEKLELYVSSYQGVLGPEELFEHVAKPLQIVTDIVVFPVPSSFIRLAGYSPGHEVLELRFGSKPTAFRYMGVAPGVWLDFVGAESHGKYFHKNIKDSFEYFEVACSLLPLFKSQPSSEHQKR